MRGLQVEGSSSYVKIPENRIGALVGPDGTVKSVIERKLKVKLDVDSENGTVTITLPATSEDPTVMFRAKEVVTAIGRGFTPEHAFRLLDDEEIMFEIIDLRDIIGRSPSDLKRLKGRLIGKEGKTRKIIEELTEANISIYGHTVGIIGYPDQLTIAREAVNMLIGGSLHGSVYRFLHKKRRELKKERLQLWETTYKD